MSRSRSTVTQVGDNIYVNVTFSPNPANLLPGPAEYVVTKTIPILDKCDDYYCSVVRFTIPLNSVPLFVMPIVPNQGNPDLTPFIIGIRTGGVNFSQPVIYASNNGTLTAPIQNQTTQVVTPYYFVFEYQNLITAVNLALAAAFVASGLVGNAPYFYLDTSTQLINLVVDVANFAPVAPGVPVATIYMNLALVSYFIAFEGTFLGLNPGGRDFEFDLVRFGFDTTIPPFTPAATQKKFSQEYFSLEIWSSLRKIIITTNSIPIISEYTPTNNSGISSTLPIITDFVPQLEQLGASRSIAYYTPTAQYRLVDLKSSEHLNTIDLKIYWQDTASNIFPLLLSFNQQASIKLGFFKKAIYRYPQNLIK